MSYSAERSAQFLAKAQENFPKMYYKEVQPLAEISVLKKGDSILLDLGNHYVGHFSCDFDKIDDFI